MRNHYRALSLTLLALAAASIGEPLATTAAEPNASDCATNSIPSAHPFHVSYAEVEWNKDAKLLEVALHLWPDDLEEALENLHREELTLEDEGRVDELIQQYLKNNFRVLAKDGTPARLKWLGKEVSVKSAWLYFEIPLEEEPQDYEIEYRVLFDQLEDQVNTVRYRTGRRRMSLRFDESKAKQKIDYEKLTFGL